MNASPLDQQHMCRALELARQGLGLVEPNPQVGCVIAIADEIVAEGCHHQFGKPHAEADAISKLPDNVDLANATIYVTLEPCCHTGKTPPCTEAILSTGIRRVVISVEDPFPAVAGKGIDKLRSAGLQVVTGVEQAAGRRLLAPYLKLQENSRPWIIAKWAMTLDGKLATSSGDSQWISSPKSREIVHQLRGRVDGVLVGSGTALADNPQLTARPAGPRIAQRIVLDSNALLAEQLPESNLARTAHQVPVTLFASVTAPSVRVQQLRASGIEVVLLEGKSHEERIDQLLLDLGARSMTNVLVEGGAGLFGLLMDAKQIDEVHAFIAPKLVGGTKALSPIHGAGIATMANAVELCDTEVRQVDRDIYIHGRVAK